MFHGNRTIKIYQKNKVFNIIAYILIENHLAYITLHTSFDIKILDLILNLQ